MKVSLNTIRQYTDVDLSVDALVAKLNQQLGSVEAVTDLGERYKGATIVRIVSCVDHPDADRLHVCLVDDGGTTPDVDRDADGYVQVVCGAPNVRADMFVVWLPPGATVPITASDPEPFVLGARELRGVVSNGMLASGKELGIGDDHDGILEIDPNEWKPDESEIKPGTRFASAYGLDDTVIDIENKMFTHRPDCFGQLGIAREIAGIQHNAFSSPEWYKALPEFNRGEGLDLIVKNDALAVVPRFMTVALKDVTIKPSPLWLRVELVRLGSKPINNVVDVTNYVMLLTGQPLHAYDYGKLAGGTLGARMAHDGEVVTLLNDKSYHLTTNDVVIVDGNGPVGLGGVMGGRDSEVTSETKNIVLECATFDMYAVRKTSMRHGLFTDAVTRFNKGQSPTQNAYALQLAIQSLADTAGGTVASEVFDESSDMSSDTVVTVTPAFINERLGLELGSDEIKVLLQNVEFSVDGDDSLTVTAPFWRTDIESGEDVVEEVGRLYGFDKLPRELPWHTMSPVPRNPKLVTKDRIRNSLAQAGANEVLTYSFVHEKTMQKAEQDTGQAFQLSNALSPDLQYYRLSVLPSLLDKVRPNIKNGYDTFALFEIGKGHNKQFHADDDDGLPSELEFVDMVYTSKKPQDGAAFYRLRRLVVALTNDLGLGELVMKPVTEPLDYPVTAPFEHSRLALVETVDGVFIGMIGELKQTVLQGFKLPNYTAAATLDFDGLHKASSNASSAYRPLSRFPNVTQDISLRVPIKTNYDQVRRVVESTLRVLTSPSVSLTCQPVAIYQPETGTTKTITFRIDVVNYEKTLTDKEVSEMLGQVAADAHESIDAERI